MNASDCMNSTTELRIKGKSFIVPSAQVGGRTVVLTGKWLKLAAIHDEEWKNGQILSDPQSFIVQLKETPLKNADVFTFAQAFDDPKPKFPFRFEWDNVAATPTTSFATWWEKRVIQETRKNTRRSEKRGVVVKEVEFDDALVRGIMGVYNADELRQTGRFWHYGKSFETVKKENATYLDTSCFIGAYFGEELVGFVKLTFVENAGSLMQVVAKAAHRDKRPIYPLVAKAVEICEKRKMAYLIYGKYIYGNKTDDLLTEFKRRTGFEMMRFPRYYVPMTWKGKAAVAMGLHRGLLGNLPPGLIRFLLNTRGWLLRRMARRPASAGGWGGASHEGQAGGD
jgi:hypothetical protein